MIESSEINNLILFLDKIGAYAPDTPEEWYDSEDIWMEYFEKADVPNNHHYLFSDWSEVAPAMRTLSHMIKAGVFR